MGMELLTLHGHNDLVRGVCFSNDGNYLVSTSADKTVRLWDVHVAAPVQTLDGGIGPIASVGFSGNGKLVVARSRRGLRAWNAATGVAASAPAGANALATQLAATAPAGKWIAWCSGEKVFLRAAGSVRPSGPPGQPEEERRIDLAWHHQQAHLAELTGRWPLALFHLDRLLNADPESISARSRRIRVLARLDRWADATTDLLVLADKWPREMVGRYRDGFATGLLVTDLIRLTAELEKRLERDRDSWQAWAARGRLMLGLRQWDRASADLAEATHRDPQRPWLWALRACAELRAGRPNQALTTRAQLAKLPRIDLTAWHRQEANLCALENDWPALHWHFERLLADCPGETRLLLLQRGHAGAALERWREAAADFGRAVALDGTDLAARCAHAHACMAAKHRAEYRQQRAFLLRQIERGFDSEQTASLLRTCALIDGDEKEWPKLAQLAERTVASHMGYAEHHALGAFLLRAGSAVAATRHLKEALTSRREGFADTTADELLLALACARQGERREARAWLNRSRVWFNRPLLRFQLWYASGASASVGTAATGPLPGLTVPGILPQPYDSRRDTLGWEEWLELQMLAREVEAVVGR
jgi:hypothetical protein